MTLSIQEASEKMGLSSYTLRYYEKEQIIPKISRNSSGHRIYTEDDINWINFINCLKSTGMPISEIKRFMQLYQSGDSSLRARIDMLVSHKNRVIAKIRQCNDYLDKINWKIEYYEGLEIKQNKS